MLDIQEEQGVRHVPVNGTIVEKRHDQTYYTIDSEKYIYVARRSMTSRGDRAVPLTIKGSVKFAIDDQDLLLIDEKGKEHRFAIRGEGVTG